jgi:hypothetical protein
MGVPRYFLRIPEMGFRNRISTTDYRREPDMKLVRRVAIALGSIAAVMLAGGAHFKIT